MEIITMKLVDLVKPEKNVRIHTEQQLKEFQRSVKMFGQIRPIVVDENNVILAGNGLYETLIATVYKGNIIKNLIMDCQSYTKYRPNETTGGIFVSWRRKEELPTGA